MQTPSPAGTVLTLNGTSLVDAAGNTWTLDNGQVEVNGTVDPATADIVALAYVNGAVWQQDTNLLWWSKGAPSQPWSPPGGTTVDPLQPQGNPASDNDTAVYLPGQTITDAAGNTWSISPAGQVLVNGQADQNTAGVIEMAYVNGRIYQENSNFLWWSTASPGGSWSSGDGTPASPLPAPGTSPSADNTVATQPGQTITDAAGNTWSISPAGQVLVNGAADHSTASVVQLAYENGLVWQENAAGLWYSKSAPAAAWGPPDGTSASPFPPGSTPVQAGPLALAWLGGGGNLASDPADWSGAQSPAPGDTLQVTGPATINLAGNALAGGTLSVAANTVAAPVTINTSAAAQLSLSESLSLVDLNVADTTTVTLSTLHGSLNASGGTLQFVGDSTLNGALTFNDALSGNGTLTLAGGEGEGCAMTINGAVGSGLTFELGASAPVLTLQIDQPAQFAGLIDIASQYPSDSFGDILFAGLKATGGTLENGVLALYSGATLIDSARLAGQTTALTLDQTSAGVVLSQNHLFGGDAGAVALPLAT